MPEQLTKHPEVTLQVLRSAGGAKCGEGAPQAILKSCPAERFCALPGGEICVYGLPEATRMTQIAPAELLAAAGGAASPAAPPVTLSAPPPAAPPGPSFDVGSAAVGVLVGAVLAAAVWRLRRPQR